MRNLITCLSVCVLSGATFADTWTVDDDGKADFDNIQAAVDAASDGDEIIVMPGTYTGNGNQNVVDLSAKAITLRSSEGPMVTVIDGQGARRGILCFTNCEATIEGFTIANGFAGEKNGAGGGGTYVAADSSALFRLCIFDSCHANSGGAIFSVYAAEVEVIGCVFQNNTAEIAVGNAWEHYEAGGTCTIDSSVLYQDQFLCEDCYWGQYGTDILVSNSLLCDVLTGTDAGGNIYAEGCDPIATFDCNNNEQLDILEIQNGTAQDNNDNGIPDECECLADVNGDGYVDVTDLLAVIDVWGCDDCSDVDVNLDGIINLYDLLIVFNAWGPCE